MSQSSKSNTTLGTYLYVACRNDLCVDVLINVYRNDVLHCYESNRELCTRMFVERRYMHCGYAYLLRVFLFIIQLKDGTGTVWNWSPFLGLDRGGRYVVFITIL